MTEVLAALRFRHLNDCEVLAALRFRHLNDCEVLATLRFRHLNDREVLVALRFWHLNHHFLKPGDCQRLCQRGIAPCSKCTNAECLSNRLAH